MNARSTAHRLATAVLCICALVFAACATPRVRAPLPVPHTPVLLTEDSPIRRHAPHAFEARPHPLPTIQQFTLENGFTVYLVEQPSADSVATGLICRRCGDDELLTPPGLAGLTWRTLARTASGSHRRVNGLPIAGYAWQNAGGLRINAPAGRLRDALWNLGAAVGQPNISTDAFQIERNAMLQEQLVSGHAGLDLLAAAIFGPRHPYGRRLAELRSTLQWLAPNHVETYRRSHLLASETALIVVGRTTRAALEPLAREMFGGWTAVPTTPVTPTPPALLRARLMFVDEGPVPLTHIMVAFHGVSRSSPDYPALLLLEQIIGGMFGSRLNLTLREQLGLVYSSASRSDSFRDAGMIVFGTEVETPDAVTTLRELLHALRNVHDAGVSRDELLQARTRWHTEMHARMEDLDWMLYSVSTLFENSLPTNEYERLGAVIDSLTTDDLNRVAAARVLPDEAMTLVAGDREAIGEGVQRVVSTVEFFDAR